MLRSHREPMTPSSDHRRVDVAIIGAGPAGTSAAITARRAGLTVCAIDRATFPRDKICGDGLTTSALRELEALGLDPATIPSWIDVDEVTVRSPSGREVRFPMDHDDGIHAAVCRRRDLDAELVAIARAEGAEILEGRALTAIVDAADGAHLTTDADATIIASHVIAADGMWSPTRKLLGIAQPDYRGEWHAFRQYVTDVSPRAAGELIVWFEADLLPGYAWSFPIADGVANIGFGILRDGGSYRVPDMAALWRDLLRRPHIRAFLGADATPEGPHRAWPIPARVDRVELSSGRVLFVGDAAAATDPMTGEGIGQALLTGRWAAEAIIAHGPDLAARDAQYRHEVHRDLVVDHHLAEVLSKVLEHPLGARGAVRVAGLNDWTRRNFGRWLFEDYPRAVMLTPSRWHRGMLTGPGAYRGRHAHTPH